MINKKVVMSIFVVFLLASIVSAVSLASNDKVFNKVDREEHKVARVESASTFTELDSLVINEVELNPEGADSGNEWVELYSENEADMTGLFLENNDGKFYDLNGSFSGYFVVIFDTQWLDNSDEEVMLRDGNNKGALIDETPNLDDNDNDNNAWSLCGGEWIFVKGSQGQENDCVVDVCVGDIDSDGVVGTSDLIILLGNWGTCPKEGECVGDLSDNGVVNSGDLNYLLDNWGVCAE